MLETLAALAMMAIVALALYSAFGTAFSAQRRTHERLAPARIAEQTLTVVCDDLSAALPPRGVFSGPMTSTDETGVAGEPADTLRFYVHREPVEWKEGDAPAGDICELYFHLETMADGQRQQLVREIKANPLVTQDPQPRRTVIARHIRSFDLRFYDGSEWLDVWDSTQQGDRLPLAVEINLMLEEMKKPNALADADEQLLPKVHARMVRLTAAEQPEENLFRGLENPFSP